MGKDGFGFRWCSYSIYQKGSNTIMLTDQTFTPWSDHNISMFSHSFTLTPIHFNPSFSMFRCVLPHRFNRCNRCNIVKFQLLWDWIVLSFWPLCPQNCSQLLHHYLTLDTVMHENPSRSAVFEILEPVHLAPTHIPWFNNIFLSHSTIWIEKTPEHLDHICILFMHWVA